MVEKKLGSVRYDSARAVKARYARILTPLVRGIVAAVSVALMITGLLLLLSDQAAGWLALAAAIPLAMILEWYTGELQLLAPNKNVQTYDDVLASELLGQIRESTSLHQFAELVGRTNEALFFAVRYGVSPRILSDISEQPDLSIKHLFEKAEIIRYNLDAPLITPGMIVCSFVQNSTAKDVLLSHLHIDEQDLISGVKWQLHLNKLIAAHIKRKRTGGIGRDWSFGYTPLLSRFGRNISHEVERTGGALNVEITSHQKIIDQVIQTFETTGRQNVVLVGPTGVGKTLLVEALAERLLDASAAVSNRLKFRQIVMLDAASMIAAAPGKGEIEQLTMEVLSEAYVAKNIILCLDNAELFFEEGVGSVDITNVLLPAIESGNLRLIMTMDEQRFLKLSQRNPALTAAINRLTIAPATEQETIEVMQDQLILMEFKYDVTYTYQSLHEVYRLSNRYVYDVAMPGQALSLLESAAHYAENGLVTINSVQQAIEQTMEIKVSIASEQIDRDTLLNLESLIHERMINQVRAVGVVSDALRRARSGVRNNDRPIGTFLFLGPTGVGKTELAKALADVYFSGQDHMIRLDLNEYVRAEDVSRLIADGANDPTSLTAQVRKRPYSVILLDEIEKAHSSVLTTLLQVLDEGILRDINNREVSFRDAIIIATSNAGSDLIREYIQRGYKLAQFEEQLTNSLIESGQFKPEFLNRFDEIVTFTPLTKEDLLKVVDLMIAGVNKTLQTQKVSVKVSDEAKQLLVEHGYDPRLGARPMRRMVQKVVENTIAKEMLKGNVSPGDVITINADHANAILDSRKTAEEIAQASKH